jgi:hypothetical protein
MTLKETFQKRLERGDSADDLLDVVRDYKSNGLSQREAYDELQELWLSYGFDDDDRDGVNPLRDNLEYAMEVVWGFCPSGQGIWDGSLSQQRQPT